MQQIRTTLQQLHERSTSFCTSKLTADELSTLLADVRRAERAITSIKVKVGQRSDQLAADQRGPGASEAFVGSGEVSNRSARQDAERARTAADIAGATDALSDGAIGGEHLDSLGRARRSLDDELQPLFDQGAADLISKSDNTSVDAFDKKARRLAERIANDHGLARAKRQRAATELRTWADRDGMGNIRGTFDPELYERLTNAISRQSRAMAQHAADAGEPVQMGRQLDALALVELVGHGNGAQGRPDITVVIDADTVLHGPHNHSTRETVTGQILAYETIRRLCCDADVRTVRLDPEGVPIHVGRRYRTATTHQWAALRAIYATCAWEGCDRPITWCQAHHLVQWEHGGPTDLDNLVPLCNQHHHAVHEGQWAIKLLPDRSLRIFRPDGRHHATAKPNRCDHRADVSVSGCPPERKPGDN